MTEDVIKIPTGGMSSLFGNSGADEVCRIALDQIDDYPNHPYPVPDDDTLFELISSIEKNGQLEPVLLRDMKNGRYQLLSGHRRKLAMEKLGFREIRAVVLSDLTDNQAASVMLDCNVKRAELLPTEKGRIYFEKKKLYQSMNKTELYELRELFGADEKYSVLACIAKRSEESETQIKRYIRLYVRADESLQELVDSGRLSLRTADELTSLSRNSQKLITDEMAKHKKNLSYEQACSLRDSGEELTEQDVLRILGVLMPESAKSKKFKFIMSDKQLRKYFPEEYSPEQITETILSLLAGWKEANFHESAAGPDGSTEKNNK